MQLVYENRDVCILITPYILHIAFISNVFTSRILAMEVANISNILAASENIADYLHCPFFCHTLQIIISLTTPNTLTKMSSFFQRSVCICLTPKSS